VFKSYTRKFTFVIKDESFLLLATRFTGLEKLYKNGNLISQKRAFLKNKHHIFELEDKEYKVKMEEDHIKGTSCSIYIGESLIDKYIVISRMPTFVNMLRPVILLVLIFLLAPYINSRVISPAWFLFGIFLFIAINNQVVLYFEHIEKSNA